MITASLTVLLALSSQVFAQPPVARFSQAGIPAAVDKATLRGWLQEFVDQRFGKSFRDLGVEDDFDHGHMLFAAGAKKPFAVLYHTQELAKGAAVIDPDGRNWIQWTATGLVENARRYVRTAYPHSAAWDWFVYSRLPALRKRRTILDKMLDPARLGESVANSVQWTFTRVSCGPAAAAADSNVISIDVPGRSAVCLALSAS